MDIEHATAPQPVGFIHFHGYHLLIVRHQGIEYTEAKPVSDLCELDWRSTKRTISSAENAILYATTALLAPQIGSSGGTSTPLSDDSGATRGQRHLYLRLDRVRMFMARINTAHVRAKGKAATADFLLALQIEWADVLHRYETQGIAVKPGRSHALRELHQMIRSRERVRDPQERAALTALIHQELAAIGLPVNTLDNNAQQSALPLPLSPV